MKRSCGHDGGCVLFRAATLSVQEVTVALSAVHIRTTGFKCEVCPQVVRRALKGVPGVSDVIAVASMRLTSVLYDPSIVAVSELRSRLERCGFHTDRIVPGQ